MLAFLAILAVLILGISIGRKAKLQPVPRLARIQRRPRR